MTNDIKQLVSMCPDCVRVLPSQPASPMITASPSSHFGFPMQHLRLDLFSFGGKDYFICVDHWSGYPFYQLLRSLTSDSILKVLTSWFNLFGWPSSIRSDEGPQFRGDFLHFFEKHGIRHELSAPYNLKSNGLAEAGVKSVQNWIMTDQSFLLPSSLLANQFFSRMPSHLHETSKVSLSPCVRTVFNVDNRFFTCPRCLLRPVHPDTPTSPVLTPAPVSSPSSLQRSLRLQSRVNTAVLQTPLLPSSLSIFTSTWLHYSSATDKASSTTSRTSNSSKNGGARPRQPLLPLPLPSISRTGPTSPSLTQSTTNQMTSPWISRTAFPLSMSTGRPSALGSLQSSSSS